MPKRKAQKCLICGGALRPATTTLTLERNGVAVHFSGVPCLRCVQCGEEEFEGPLTVELGKVAEAFFQTGETIAALPAPIRHVHVDFAPERAPVTASGCRESDTVAIVFRRWRADASVDSVGSGGREHSDADETILRAPESRQAQRRGVGAAALGLMKDGKHKHPFYWVPFVLMGDWR